MTISELFKSWRKKRKMTLSEMAIALGYKNRQTIYLIERGKSGVNLKTMIKFRKIVCLSQEDRVLFSQDVLNSILYEQNEQPEN